MSMPDPCTLTGYSDPVPYLSPISAEAFEDPDTLLMPENEWTTAALQAEGGPGGVTEAWQAVGRFENGLFI